MISGAEVRTDGIRSLLARVRSLEHSTDAGAREKFTTWKPLIARRAFVAAAWNFANYIALRRHDLRELQTQLMPLGLSSLGRCESRVRPSLDAVIGALAAQCGETVSRTVNARRFFRGERLLAAETARVFGPPNNAQRTVRIMVTLPSEAASDGGALIRSLVDAGMDSARINCAHDDLDAWRAMAGFVHDARERSGRHCSVYIDLAGPKIRTGAVHMPGDGRVYIGDKVFLVRSLDGVKRSEKAFTCSVPEVFDCLHEGDLVWIDDGHIGCDVVRCGPDRIKLRVTQARDGGDKLRPEKGLNFPMTRVPVTPLGEADRAALAGLIDLAEIVGYSFVREASDIVLLQDELKRLGRPDLPITLKIETAEAVKNLPELIVTAAGRQPCAVMIARGDLLVEIGYRRLAEIQEEILWLCEAASVPVIWATQVLDNFVKTGVPTRAEVTDAAMAERAECVMLNKGAHVVRAVETLNDVLPRMAAHQSKKTSRLRALHSW